MYQTGREIIRIVDGLMGVAMAIKTKAKREDINPRPVTYCLCCAILSMKADVSHSWLIRVAPKASQKIIENVSSHTLLGMLQVGNDLNSL